jgi:hypothetical protein
MVLPCALAANGPVCARIVAIPVPFPEDIVFMGFVASVIPKK